VIAQIGRAEVRSFHRQGVPEDGILHAVEHALAVEDLGEEPDRGSVLGPDAVGNLLRSWSSSVAGARAPDGSWRPAPPGAVRKWHHGDALIAAEVHQVRVGSGQRRGGGACLLCGDAVGEAHRPVAPVVVLSPEKPCSKAEVAADGCGVSETELGEVERSVLVRCPHEPDEMVGDFGDPDGGQLGIVCVQEASHVLRSWLAPQEGDHRKCVEDGHRPLRRSC
jgi:hypothetical protein